MSSGSKIHALEAQGAGKPLSPFAGELRDLRGEAGELEHKLLHFLENSGPHLRTWALSGAHSTKHLGGGFEALSGTVAEAMEQLQTNTEGVLKSFGAAKIPTFQVQSILKGFGPAGKGPSIDSVPEFADGGTIVPGSAEGDVHSTYARPGTFILNKKATQAYGFQAGGQIPVMLEPGEARFEPEAVAQIGLHNLMAMNESVPRFAKGGLTEPKIAGPDPLAALGQSAVHKAYASAEGYISAHRPTASAGAIGGLNVPTGPIEQMAREMVTGAWDQSQWAPFASLEAQEAGWNPQALNPSSGAAGLAQALPPSKYPAGAWPYTGLNSAKLQLQWMMSYIKERYGSPAAAWAHEQSAGWYAEGGLVDGFAKGGAVGLADGGKVPGRKSGMGGPAYAEGGPVGFAKGGAPAPRSSRHNENLVNLQQKAEDTTKLIWRFAAPYYGDSPGSEPPAFGVMSGIPKADAGWTEKLEDNSRRVDMSPAWTRRLTSFQDTALMALIHEWAHVHQRGMTAMPEWEREGGAEAFDQYASGPILHAMANDPDAAKKLGWVHDDWLKHFRYSNGSSYGPFVKDVLKKKGWDWVKKGQFGGPQKLAGGGLVGAAPHLAAGGSVGKLPPGIVDLPDRAAPPAEIMALRKAGVRGFAKGGVVTPMEAMLGEAGALAGTPYVYGGGHSGEFVAHPASLDCSSAVSYVLHAGDLLDTVDASPALESWGTPGTSDELTVYANPGHAWMELDGRPWGTSVGDGGSGGLGWHPQPSSSYKSKFTARHTKANLGATKAQEVAGTYQEKVPAVYEGAHTGSLSLSSSTPDTLHAINRELARRHHEHDVYTAAAATAEKANKPAVAHKISLNIAALQKRIRELNRAKDALRKKEEQERKAKRLAAAKKRVATHLAGQLGKVTGLETPIAGAQRAYEERSQLAEQIVGMEPTQPEAGSEPELPPRPQFPKGTPEATREAGIKAWEQDTQGIQRAREVADHQAEVDYVARLQSYIANREAPAYDSVLASENAWRNLILSAENRVAGNWQKSPRPGGLEGNWETQIADLTENESLIEAFAKSVGREVERFRAQHPKAHLPEDLQARRKRSKEQVEKLPLMKARVAGLTTNLQAGREAFYPGGALISEPKPPLAGSGSLESNLEEVQGLHWPGQHEKRKHLPHRAQPGRFGGAIYATEEAIEELGLRSSAAANSIGTLAPVEGAEETEVAAGGAADEASASQLERVELENTLLRQENQRYSIDDVLGSVLGQFEASYPTGAPYMGAFAEGGVALVGETGPEIAHFPSGTRVHNADDTRSMLASQSVVIKRLEVHPDRVHVEMENSQMKAVVHEVLRSGESSPGIPTAASGHKFLT